MLALGLLSAGLRGAQANITCWFWSQRRKNLMAPNILPLSTCEYPYKNEYGSRLNVKILCTPNKYVELGVSLFSSLRTNLWLFALITQ